MYWVYAIGIHCVWIAATIYTAHRKYRDTTGWAIAGIFLGIIAFVIVLLLPTREMQRLLDDAYRQAETQRT